MPSSTPSTGRASVQRRGEDLRRHVLVVAKDVFLEEGYERASMDLVAARAGTSKRSLYAHFENKASLFQAVLDLVRELYANQLGHPEDYAADRTEAVVRFCGRVQQLMVWQAQVRTCRLVMAEAERLPDAARAYLQAVLSDSAGRLAEHLEREWQLGPGEGARRAQDLLDDVVLPRLFRTLLAVDPPLKGQNPPAASRLARDVDLEAVRRRLGSAADDIAR